MKKSSTFNIILAGFFIALGVLLPVAFHSLGLAGSIFLPMHIPVILAGLICGPIYGAGVGFIVPFLSSVTTGMPPIYPVAVFMAFELAAYGALSGYLIKKANVYVALLGAMLGGRVVLGVAQGILLGFFGNGFALSGFITGAFVTALPGIIVQIILIPLIYIGLKKGKVID